MRKIFINFTITIVLIILTGCSSTNNDLSGVEKAYFDCIEEIVSKSNITPKDTMEILNLNIVNTSDDDIKEYIYDGEFNSVYPTVIYRYTNNNEIIKVEYIKDTGCISQVSYETTNNHQKNKLMFVVDNNNEGSLRENFETKFTIEYNFTDLDEQLRVNDKILNEADKKSDFYNAYIELCNEIHNKKNISENNIKMILPTVEVLNNNGQFFLESEDELLFIDQNAVYYSTDNINLQYSANGLNKIIIEPETLKEQEELYKRIY